jgi:16S rRNA (guanine527-N7)-methyltransferase
MNAEAVLAQGLQDLGLTLEPERLQRLLAHMDLLLKWNRVYNLTAVRDPGEMLTHHLLDCLSVLPPLMRYTRGQALRVLDVGSGGGLPGAVLAICRPELDVTCVDTVAKKAAFIQQVAGTLGVSNLHSTHARVESLSATWPLVISRAFASLADFTLWSSAALSPGGVWLAMKGKNPQAEITELPPPVQVFHVEPLTVPGLSAERCLVWMRPRA